MDRDGSGLTHDSEKTCPGGDPELRDVSSKIMREDMKIESEIARSDANVL
jgi:hypothetical protein